MADDLKDKMEIEKMRQDKAKLSQQQQSLQRQRKGYKKDPIQRSTVSGKIADIQKKKSDLTVKSLKKSAELKKQKTESILDSPLREMLFMEFDMPTSLQPDDADAIMIIAKNEASFYHRKDARGAIDFAVKQYLKSVIEDLTSDLNRAKPKLVKDLLAYWKREGHI